MAMSELTNLEPPDDLIWWAFWGVQALNWLFWAGVFYFYVRGVDRFTALKRIVVAVLAGSLAVALVSVPAHIVVTRRSGCFVGLGSGAGIAAGLSVMIWLFGPGIVLLFWSEKHRHQLRLDRRSGPAPDLRRPFVQKSRTDRDKL